MRLDDLDCFHGLGSSTALKADQCGSARSRFSSAIPSVGGMIVRVLVIILIVRCRFGAVKE